MPCIKIIDSIKIYVYSNDHNPPHFHAIYAEHEELIVIETLATYTGSLPNNQRKKVIAWASEKKEFILKQWNNLNL
jgi:hypothetical protein